MIFQTARHDLRIFVGMFSEEVGGKEAAAQWVRNVDSIVQLRKLNRPLPVFGAGGVLTQSDLEALARRRSVVEVS